MLRPDNVFGMDSHVSPSYQAQGFVEEPSESPFES